MRAGSETVQGLGMQDAVIARSGELRNELLDRTLAVSDRGGFFFVTSKTLRLFLQSMMLGLGAWLAIHGQVSFGVMIAASILLGRALAPIDQAGGAVAAASARGGSAALAGAAPRRDAAGAGPDVASRAPRGRGGTRPHGGSAGR